MIIIKVENSLIIKIPKTIFLHKYITSNMLNKNVQIKNCFVSWKNNKNKINYL